MMEQILQVGKVKKWKINTELCQKVKESLKTQIKIIGSGRTDKGVHALSQYANFRLKKKIKRKKTFLNSINFFLKKIVYQFQILKLKTTIFMQDLMQNYVLEYLIINRQGDLSIDRIELGM